jgi:hypothetical protein
MNTRFRYKKWEIRQAFRINRMHVALSKMFLFNAYYYKDNKTNLSCLGDIFVVSIKLMSIPPRCNKLQNNNLILRLCNYYVPGHYPSSCLYPDDVDFLNWPNSSSRTMVLWSTQPLTEMNTRTLPGGKGRLARRADNLTAICELMV